MNYEVSKEIFNTNMISLTPFDPNQTSYTAEQSMTTSKKPTDSNTASSLNKPEYFLIKNKGSGKYLEFDGQNIVESLTLQNASVFQILREPFDPSSFKISCQGSILGVATLGSTAKI